MPTPRPDYAKLAAAATIARGLAPLALAGTATARPGFGDV